MIRTRTPQQPMSKPGATLALSELGASLAKSCWPSMKMIRDSISVLGLATRYVLNQFLHMFKKFVTLDIRGAPVKA